MCVIDIYGKHAWVIPLKDKKGFTITILDEFQMNQTANQIKYEQIKVVNFIIDK